MKITEDNDHRVPFSEIPIDSAFLSCTGRLLIKLDDDPNVLNILDVEGQCKEAWEPEELCVPVNITEIRYYRRPE